MSSPHGKRKEPPAGSGSGRGKFPRTSEGVFQVDSVLTPQPMRRIIVSKQWSARANGHLKARAQNVSIDLLPAPDDQPSLFTSEDFHLSTIPEWPEDADELVGQVDAETLMLEALERATLKEKSNARPPEEPMKTWSDEIDHFLDEMIRLEGRGMYVGQTHCAECDGPSDLKGAAQFRCSDCFTDALFCSSCILKMHYKNPFHRIEEWTQPGFFEPTTLHKLGLRIQLNHPAGQRCPVPKPVKEFTVLDTYAIHTVALDFCGCEIATHHVDQLLRARLYPATMKHPRTAATFQLLKRYQILSFESKCSAYEYYCSIARETDNTGAIDQTRYREFLRITRWFGALTLFKRSGQGHDDLGVRGTKQGGCALLCPPCPHPGINLPEDWKEAPEDEKWKYTKYLAMDANFRLGRKNVSSEVKDPAVIRGYGYIVETEQYMSHLEKWGNDKQERSTCVSHDAVNSADSRDTEGCAATGCGAVDCARHEFRRPISIGDLQKGERYLNMDYLFYSSLADDDLDRLVVSYDIGCQWSVNFWDRMMRKFPETWSINQQKVDIKFLVPKFHLPAHIEKCHRDYSFNFTKYVGRTDGEAPERGWSRINDLAGSTREMGPGARRDRLELHLGDGNWKKKIKLGQTFLEKIKDAKSFQMEQASQLSILEEQLEQDWIAEWREEVEAWEKDPQKPNPYEPRVKDMTQNDVRLLLAQHDAGKKDSVGVVSGTNVTGSAMIVMGLELEEAQRRIREDIAGLGLHPTALQQAKIQERCNVLRRRITAWYAVEALHIPGATVLRTLDEQQRPTGTPEIKVYDMKLYLPSEIKSSTHVDQALQESEWLLREAQAKDALIALRGFLRVDSYLFKYKRKNARGVAQNTRSQVLIKQNLAKTKAAAMRYRQAHKALLSLGDLLKKGNEWKGVLRPLADEDIRGLPVGGVGEGKRSFSWIWLAPGVADAGDGEKGVKVQDVLRLQWLRARARVDRWSEEIVLLQEEMRRVEEFLKWEADEWRKRSSSRHVTDAALAEGLTAYAAHQAHILTNLRDRFSKNWLYVPQWLALGEGDSSGEALGGLKNSDVIVSKL